MRKLSLAAVLLSLMCSGCQLARDISHPKSDRFIRTINWESVGHEGWIPTYNMRPKR